MKKAKPNIYPIYDLSNNHFRHIEIVTKQNISMKGQFVRFKVIENDNGFKIYPSEKFCFLPTVHKTEFWNTHKLCNGEFKELPSYIKELALTDLKSILIEPMLL